MFDQPPDFTDAVHSPASDLKDDAIIAPPPGFKDDIVATPPGFKGGIITLLPGFEDDSHSASLPPSPCFL